jgi:hypothetical protein
MRTLRVFLERSSLYYLIKEGTAEAELFLKEEELSSLMEGLKFYEKEYLKPDFTEILYFGSFKSPLMNYWIKLYPILKQQLEKN